MRLGQEPERPRTHPGRRPGSQWLQKPEADEVSSLLPVSEDGPVARPPATEGHLGWKQWKRWSLSRV